MIQNGRSCSLCSYPSLEQDKYSTSLLTLFKLPVVWVYHILITLGNENN